ncbi:MAG: hypothetical protein MR919_12595 [Parabacteroides sp.]|nr:hypothetical protein [Parabacteroides sp.]
MTLIPIAKPVRIRIKSGGEEHSSLESLKRNFCLEDIKPLLDGRLIRWLQRLGKKEQMLADKLKAFDTNRLEREEGMFAFIQLFFDQELDAAHLRSLQDVAQHWLTNPNYQRNGIYLVKAFFESDVQWTDLTLAKEVYKKRLFPTQDWSAIFKGFLYQKDPELFFIYGKLLYEGIGCTKDDVTGRKYMNEAYSLGWEEAGTYLKRAEDQSILENRNLVRKAVLEIIRKEMAIHAINDRTPIRFMLYSHLRDQLLEQFNVTISSRDLQDYKTAGELADFIVKRIPAETPKNKMTLKIDLERWKNGCTYTNFVTNEDCERLWQLLKTKYQLEIPFSALIGRRGRSRLIIDYVLSQYSE